MLVKWMDSTNNQYILLTSETPRKKIIPANVCELSCVKCFHNQGSVSSPNDRRVTRQVGCNAHFVQLGLYFSGFHMHEAAFQTRDGNYEYIVVPFELCNALTSFQAMMNDLSQPLFCKTIIVFFNILVIALGALSLKCSESIFPQAMYFWSISNWLIWIISYSWACWLQIRPRYILFPQLTKSHNK